MLEYHLHYLVEGVETTPMGTDTGIADLPRNECLCCNIEALPIANPEPETLKGGGGGRGGPTEADAKVRWHTSDILLILIESGESGGSVHERPTIPGGTRLRVHLLYPHTSLSRGGVGRSPLITGGRRRGGGDNLSH